MERSALAAVWRERGHRWLEPPKVEAAGPIARLLASGVFDLDVRAVSEGFTLQQPPLIRSGEGLGFVSSLSSMSTLIADGKVAGASRRAVDGTGIKSVNARFADRETL